MDGGVLCERAGGPPWQQRQPCVILSHPLPTNRTHSLTPPPTTIPRTRSSVAVQQNWDDADIPDLLEWMDEHLQVGQGCCMSCSLWFTVL